MQHDPAMATLLDLDGSVLDQERGYWIKIKAWAVKPSPEVPHGIRYSLTLHEPYGRRILGYDNAHAVRPTRGFKYAGRILAHDHRHQHAKDKGTIYEFTDAAQLLSDFFDDVDRMLVEIQR
ncbi:hypothetical protein A3Q32_21300 [Alcanivorax sp. KX64203]|nr:hypothetical protein A3Q32_21300 [Alcanivorax sp. KX64203]